MSASLPTQKELRAHFERRDSRMAEVIREVGRFQLRRNRRYFFVLSRAIVSQQISTKAADSIFGKFQKLFDGKSLTPERVACAPESALRGAGLSRQKIAYLKDLSFKFQDKTLRSRQFAWQDNETVIETLTQVHGIGRWTAEMFLIFSLNRLDVLPVDDLGLRTAVKNIYRLKSLPDKKRLRALAKPWHPLETVATWYCWRSLDSNIIQY